MIYIVFLHLIYIFQNGGGDEPAFESLLFQDRHALGRCEIFPAEVPHGHTVPAGHLLQARVIALALLEIIFPHGSLLAGLPALVAAQDDPAVRLQLTQKRQVAAVVIAQAVDAHAAAVPAVAEGDLQLVLSLPQQL